MAENCALGIDIIEIPRIERMFERFGDHFLDKIYTENEKKYCLKYAKPCASLAGHFAAKEASAKALGTGFSNGIFFRSIEIVHAKSGKPQLRFHAAASNRVREMGVYSMDVSISHERKTAIATVLLLMNKQTMCSGHSE